MIKLYSLYLKLFRLLVRNDFYAKLTARKGWIRQVNSGWNEVLCIGNNYVKFVWFVFIKLLIFIC